MIFDTLLLSSDDISMLVRLAGIDRVMDALIDRMHGAFTDFCAATSQIPVRDGFHYDGGLIEWMPLYQRHDSVLMKIVGYHPENPFKRFVPTISSTLSLFDTTTGRLTALADGALMTAMRTGAASAVATRLLTAENVSALGLIGCGAQSVTQLHAVSRVRPIRTVRVFDTDPNVMQSFADRVSHLITAGTEILPSTPSDIIRNCDIVCTATSVAVGAGPVFDELRTVPHLHINAVGADLPGKTELPFSLLNRATVIPDFPDQARNEGECQQVKASDMGPSIVEVARHKSLPSELHSQLTVFDSTGWALEDFVALQLLMDFATEFDQGSRVAIESSLSDPFDPYEALQCASAAQGIGVTEQKVI